MQKNMKKNIEKKKKESLFEEVWRVGPKSGDPGKRALGLAWVLGEDDSSL